MNPQSWSGYEQNGSIFFSRAQLLVVVLEPFHLGPNASEQRERPSVSRRDVHECSSISGTEHLSEQRPSPSQFSTSPAAHFHPDASDES